MSISADRATPYAPAMLLDVRKPSTNAHVRIMRPQLTDGT